MSNNPPLSPRKSSLRSKKGAIFGRTSNSSSCDVNSRATNTSSTGSLSWLMNKKKKSVTLNTENADNNNSVTVKSPRTSASSSATSSPEKRRSSPQKIRRGVAKGGPNQRSESSSTSSSTLFGKLDDDEDDTISRDARFFVQDDTSIAANLQNIDRFRPSQQNNQANSVQFSTDSTGTYTTGTNSKFNVSVVTNSNNSGNSRSTNSNTYRSAATGSSNTYRTASTGGSKTYRTADSETSSQFHSHQETLQEEEDEDESESSSRYYEDESGKASRDLRAVGSSDTGSQYLSSSYDEDDHRTPDVMDEVIPKARFRGFSTSIQSLFLDEQVVCGAISCFGVLISSRSEFLLERKQFLRRKTAQRAPSRILGFTLVFCLLLISSTYVIWGFGHPKNTSDSNYNYQQRHLLTTNSNYTRPSGIAKLKDNHEWIWIPLKKMIEKEYTNRLTVESRNLGDRSLEDVQNNYYNYNNNDDNNNDDGQNNDDGNQNNDDGNQSNDDGNQNNNDDNQNNNSQNDSIGARSWREWTELAPLLRMIVCFLFLAVLGILGRRRRMRTRFAILKARAQEDFLNNMQNGQAKKSRILALQVSGSSIASNTIVQKSGDNEDKYDGACSHTLCGCYPIDPVAIDEDPVEDHGRRGGDIMQRIMSCVSKTCCGLLCRFWLQCFSVCALAQEAREVRLLVPIRYQRVDFLTHQPFSEYYKDICLLRQEFKTNISLKMRQTKRLTTTKVRFMTHLNALSKLSKILIVAFFLIVLAIVLTERLNPRATFSWADALVLIATFVQSFIVIFVVHGIFHKSDLSLDAVIKFFAAGFLIGMPTAFLFEAFVMNLLIAILYSVYYPLATFVGDSFLDWVSDNYHSLYMGMEVVIAFIVASCVEEFCKYYTFRTVEHPDLLFLTGLDRSSRSKDTNFDVGGTEFYPFSSHNASLAASRKGSFDSISTFNRKIGSNSRSHRGKAGAHPMLQNDDASIMSGESRVGEESDIRTLREQAAAITTAMISCAVGFACAENFIYVFFLGSDGRYSKTLEELAILLFRSLFPVHALCAALQSVGVIRKFLEKDEISMSMGVGKIVFSAIVLHGLFDAVLMLANAHIENSWDKFYNGEIELADNSKYPYNAILVNVLVSVSVISIMLIGLLWYWYIHRNQSSRLKRIESRSESPQKESSRRLGYQSPSMSSEQSTYTSEETEIV